MHRFALAFLFAGGIVAAATTYGCSDDAAEVPPEPDAGNPNRRPADSGGSDAPSDAPSEASGPTYKARATIAATSLADAGNVTGTVDFTETNGTVVVVATINGATAGQHGLHIHEGTSCGDIDGGAALAAGNHWNPTDAGHGLPGSPTHHAGDFGNVSVDGTGAGTLTLNTTAHNVQPDGGALSAIGHAIVFHQGTDDGTGTNGNAGGRAGCGIIQAQ